MADCYIKAPLLADANKYQPPDAQDRGGPEGEVDAPADDEVDQQGVEAVSSISEERGLDRLLELVRQTCENPEAAASSDWYLHFWAEVANELNQGGVTDEVVVTLINHGF